MYPNRKHPSPWPLFLAALACFLLEVFSSGCTPPGPAEVTPVTQCEDLTESVRAMRARCGYVDGPSTHYADCQKVKAIRDPETLESTCLPALAENCASGDTPPEWECHQLMFTAPSPDPASKP